MKMKVDKVGKVKTEGNGKETDVGVGGHTEHKWEGEVAHSEEEEGRNGEREPRIQVVARQALHTGEVAPRNEGEHQLVAGLVVAEGGGSEEEQEQVQEVEVGDRARQASGDDEGEVPEAPYMLAKVSGGADETDEEESLAV